ncbi:MAG: group II truncated hemoglobin [Qingshengfaniella sp.]
MKKTMLEEIGGEDRLRKLVNDFYDLVETLPEGENIKKLHARGHGLDHVREEQFNFLSGFLGGRRYYEEKFGHMNVKLMHEHVPISQQDAEDWLTCMDKALAQNGMTGPAVNKLRAAFRRVALLLVNDLAEWGMPSAAPGQRPAART